MPEYINLKVVALWAAYWAILFLAVSCIMERIYKVRYTKLQMKMLKLTEVVSDEELDDHKEVSLMQRIKSAKIFDKLYGKGASSDPFNDAWEGEPVNVRRKTV